MTLSDLYELGDIVKKHGFTSTISDWTSGKIYFLDSDCEDEYVLDINSDSAPPEQYKPLWEELRSVVVES